LTLEHSLFLSRLQTMVLLSTCPSPPVVPCDLRVESGRLIRYLAAPGANPRTETRAWGGDADEENSLMPTRKKHSLMDAQMDDWEGVNALCQYLDTTIDVELEHDLFDGKRVLEIGFTTGLPSVFALDNGATEVTLHCHSKADLECFVKPTLLERNGVNARLCKFSTGTVADCRRALRGKKFDVILTPELLNRSIEDFEELHALIDESLEADGICVLTSRMHYPSVDGNLPAFLSLITARRCFDCIVRWESPRSDVVRRKLVMLTRRIH